jgi:hypothetical protein
MTDILGKSSFTLRHGIVARGSLLGYTIEAHIPTDVIGSTSNIRFVVTTDQDYGALACITDRQGELFAEDARMAKDSRYIRLRNPLTGETIDFERDSQEVSVFLDQEGDPCSTGIFALHQAEPRIHGDVPNVWISGRLQWWELASEGTCATAKEQSHSRPRAAPI